MIPALADQAEYAVDCDGHFSNDKTSVCVSPEVNYLVGLLNSKVLWWFIRKTAAGRQGGFFEFKPMYVSALPIPPATPEDRKAVEGLVKRILQARQRDNGADVETLEQELDELIYALYDLTPAEIKLVQA